MALTKVSGDFIQNGSITQGHLHTNHGITTTHIAEGDKLFFTNARVDARVQGNLSTSDLSEGTNLYYTDARVGSYLTTNSYATQGYVNTQISNLVDSAPGTLDTLNELAAALGDDANFSTTVTNSIATKMPLAGGTFTGGVTITTSNSPGLKISKDRNTDNRFLRFNDTGTSGKDYDIINNGNLAFYNHTDNNYILQITSGGNATFTGTLTASGYNNSNWDTAYGWGNHASAGYLASSSYTAADVLSKILTVDGPGSGLNADLLDGIGGDGYLRSNATDTASGALTFTSTDNHYNGHFYYDPYDSNGNHYPHFYDGANAGGVDINWRLYTGSTNSHTHIWNTTKARFVTRVESSIDMRTPIFYDIDDTNCYLDPAGTSQVNAIEFVGSTNNARIGQPVSTEWGTRITTDSGYILFGPANTAHAHIYTDRPNFYFNKQIQLLGGSLINQNDIRAQVFYDLNNTGRYIDPAGTSSIGGIGVNGQLSMLGNNIIVFGANTGWGKYLAIGGNANNSTSDRASIGVTNGNLHIDAAISHATYLNYYDGTAGIAFGSGSSSVVAWMGPDGDLWKGSADNTGYKYWHAANDGAGSTLDADLLDGQHASAFASSSHTHAASDITSGNLPAARNTANLVYVGNSVDASGIYFRSTNEVISGEGWCTAQYAYNENDGILFLNRNSSGTAFPTFHIGGWNNAGYAGYSNADGLLTLTRSDGTKSTGTTYAGRGLSNTSYYTNIIKTTTKTVFKDAQSLHEFTGNVQAGTSTAHKITVAGNGNYMNINYDQIWNAGGNLHLQYSSSGNIDMNQGGGYAFSRTSLRAPIFYDYNDTAYYIDPNANGSRLKNLQIHVQSQSWSEGIRFDMPTQGQWGGLRWARNGTNSNGGNWALGYPGNLGNIDDFTFYSGTGNHRWRLNHSGDVTVQGSSRAPIFYDSDNTNYYLNPTSTSNLSKAIFNTSSTGLPRQITIKEDGDTENSMGSYPGAWTSALNIQSNDGSTYLWFSPLTSNIPRIQTNYGQIDFYTGNNTNRALHLSGTSARSEVFYDLNNTGKYIDPNGTSVINKLNATGGNTTGTGAPGYAGGAIEIVTSGNYVPAIGFHRGGYSATTLYEYDGELYVNPWTTRAQAGKLVSTGNISSIIYSGTWMGSNFAGTRFAGYSTDGGEIAFLKNNPSSGKNSILVDGSYYAGENGGFWSIWSGNNYNNRVGIYGDSSGNLQIGTSASENVLRTNHGYIQMGPMNTSHAHIYTDRANFYFNKQIQLLGGTLINQNDIQSVIYYDRSDTSKYCDPNGVSQFSGLTVTNRISGSIDAVGITGYQNNSMSFQQTSGSFAGRSGWHNHIVCNHGNGSNYYNTVISMDFWGAVYHSRLEGGTFRGPYMFCTAAAGFTSGNEINSSLRMKASEFWDYNNTNYYAHLDSTGYSIRIAGTVQSNYSDIQLKDVIENIPNALDKVNQLNGFYYYPNEIAQGYGYKKKKEVGLSAQEVEAVLPEIVDKAPVSDKYKTIQYERVVPLLVEAIKELKADNDSLRARIETLENQ